ncbi:efflux RND transporter periplasmic adaptor subunit [Verrucomicrobium sp. BvORR106]|uniref:efflux RND transporter periplasmic adaptor subunit n=1 Tax=Verrucomicrobium sp. BvORR106 TaxID=1403819 RepID=UPI00068E53D8|nr:efflux RND transporter periplasmic adaptor subunit [Verrucomicrobium sp. BvORR106]
MKPSLLLPLLMLPLAATGADPANPPSQVTNGVMEAALPTLKITAQAEKRLGVEVAEVVSKAVHETRLFAGEVMLSLSSRPDLLAPMPPVTTEELRRLAELQNVADGAVASAQVQVDAAQITVQRTTQLARERAGSERAMDDARTAEAVARTALSTAKNQRDLLGLPVAEALKSTRRTVRVSISSLELPSLDTAQPATASTPADKGKSSILTPQPLQSSGNIATGTVDLFYALDEKSPPPLGQRLMVHIPVKDVKRELPSVPWSSLFYDAHGGAWVYEQTAPQTFVRRRIQVRRVEGDAVLLDSGLPVGTTVVKTGAAELFGAEFGNGK